MSESAEKAQFPVPEGWLAFGSLIDYDGLSECSEETGEDGLPLWERPISSPPEMAWSCCGHAAMYHGPEVPGCAECRCGRVTPPEVTPQ